MSPNRTMIVLTALILCTVPSLGRNEGFAADQRAAASTSGPALGKWAFTGKDESGSVWTGQLTIGKLDSKYFDVKTYFALCTLEVQVTDKTTTMRSVEAPCKYDAATRTMSFSTSTGVAHIYTAVLSPDGKSLTKGKWTDMQKTAVVRNGEWSAKLR